MLLIRDEEQNANVVWRLPDIPSQTRHNLTRTGDESTFDKENGSPYEAERLAW